MIIIRVLVAIIGIVWSAEIIFGIWLVGSALFDRDTSIK